MYVGIVGNYITGHNDVTNTSVKNNTVWQTSARCVKSFSTKARHNLVRFTAEVQRKRTGKGAATPRWESPCGKCRIDPPFEGDIELSIIGNFFWRNVNEIEQASASSHTLIVWLCFNRDICWPKNNMILTTNGTFFEKIFCYAYFIPSWMLETFFTEISTTYICISCLDRQTT